MVIDTQREKLITAADAAEIARVKPGTIRKWFDSGKLPYVRLPSGRKRTSREAVLRAINPEPLADLQPVACGDARQQQVNRALYEEFGI